MYLVHERAWYFPKTCGENFAIEDSLLNQYFNGHYHKFKEKMSNKQFKFDKYCFEYINGNKEKFRRSCMDVEYVYYACNVNKDHWIMCQICLTSWIIIAYVSDIACSTQNRFEQCMEPICNILPYLLL